MTTTKAARPQGQAASSAMLWLLFLVDAGLLVTSGIIHFHLWDIAYRHVKTLDVLFPVQAAAAILAAIVLLVTRHILVVAGSAALLAGTIAGFILARTVGIFGFHLTFSSGLANVVLVVEAAGVVLLSLTGGLMLRHRS